MKKLILILILTLNFQSWAKADDIRDFEIQGISLGESLLKIFSKEEIQKFIQKSMSISLDMRLIKNYENNYISINIDI